MQDRIKFMAAVLFFRVALDICYIFYMVPAFENHFLTPMKMNFSGLNYSTSYCVVLLVAALSPMGKRNLNGIFFLSFNMFIFLPMTTMYGFNEELSFKPIWLGLLAEGTALFVVRTSVGNMRFPLVKNGERLVIGLCLSFMIGFVLLTFATGAISGLSFDLTKIYLLRSQTEAKLDIGPFIYTNLWTQKIFTPFIMAISLYKGNRTMVILAVAMHVFYFGITQHRLHLFVPLLIYMMYRLYKSKISIADLNIYGGIGVFAALGLTLALDLDQFAAIILRRALFVAASVTFDWVAYFDLHPKVLFSDRFLAWLITSEYNGIEVPYLLGDHKRFGLDIGLNSGLIGAGYAQLGAAGVVLYAFILASCVKIVNLLIRQGLPVIFAAPILIAPLRTAWSDSDLFTTILSHGIGVAIVVFWLYGRPSTPEARTR